MQVSLVAARCPTSFKDPSSEAGKEVQPWRHVNVARRIRPGIARFSRPVTSRARPPRRVPRPPSSTPRSAQRRSAHATAAEVARSGWCCVLPAALPVFLRLVLFTAMLYLFHTLYRLLERADALIRLTDATFWPTLIPPYVNIANSTASSAPFSYQLPKRGSRRRN